jgi:hypothetical protein
VTLQSTLEGVKEGVKTYKEEGEGDNADIGPVETSL